MNRENADCMEICTREEIKGVIWWEVGVWTLKWLRRGMEIGYIRYVGKKKKCGTYWNAME
jgi:hypothetical protein